MRIPGRSQVLLSGLSQSLGVPEGEISKWCEHTEITPEEQNNFVTLPFFCTDSVNVHRLLADYLHFQRKTGEKAFSFFLSKKMTCLN